MASMEPEAEQLAAAFANVARALSTAADTAELLTGVASLAVATIESCDFAGVMARREGAAVTLAESEPIVRTLDLLQIEADEGPCLDVLAGAGSQYAADLADGGRWSRFGARAVDAGVRSVLALDVSADDTPGALNLYARLPHAFAPTDRAQAAIFATHAALAIERELQRSDQENLAAHLQQALTTRELIGQAQGILMERDRISADQAFDVLRQASQRLNVKLRDVAQRLVDTGESP